MNNVFNRLQTLKSSEDCNKFSKSVSYETLVGGTTTICKWIKQNQRLFLSSANKPLTAVGTLTSLLCNSAKVVEKWLQTLPVFRLVKIIILISVLSVGMVAESRAACNITNDNGDTVDESGNYCGTCGTDCHWVLDGEGNMKITGSGKMADYHPTCVDGCTTPDRPWQKYRKQITSVDIQGVENVGVGAFYYIPITNLTLGNTVTSLGGGAFEQHHLQTIELPDSLESISQQALATKNNDYTIIIPDTLNYLGNAALNSSSCSSICANSNIICRGETTKCENIKTRMLEISPDLNFSLADSSNCDTENFYWTGTNCARKDENGNISCASGYAEYKNKCWDELPFAKKRWTPAEANEWLHDGNDNFVVITFKK